MKTIAALILSMIFGIHFIVAQNQPVKAAQPVQPTQAAQPAQSVEKTYAWNETIHDFGKIPVNIPASVTFTVKNNGTTPLLISAAKSSCGCTVAEYTKEPIKPGESGIAKATYNAAHAGPFTKTVTVTFDGIAAPDVLTIKGEVEAPPAAPAPAPAPAPAGGTNPVK
jgi:hypothetical protein